MKPIRPQPVDWKQVDRYRTSAEKRLAAAQKVVVIDDEAAFVIAYEAMLKAALGFMLSHGVRPSSGPGHHMVIIGFAKKNLAPSVGSLLDLFDRMRRKRNQSLYDATGMITRTEVEQAIGAARKLISLIGRDIDNRKPRGNNP